MISSGLSLFLSSIPSEMLTSDFTSIPTSSLQNTSLPAPPQNANPLTPPPQGTNPMTPPHQNVIQNSDQTGLNPSRSGSPGSRSPQ
jgi:hypothetical protein